ncbi:hypothetical protein N2599_18545 [Rhizobium sullae]|uniref:Uncharacterized protein n=1 Tax=Rhizobium sullae TaxID=50338 RepID=A0ABY5XHP0_RHISU|nr:hypothetical protein [Rhizobium sullae]UWU14090.1 hypothetical protein N2599_18545 [Rhizobium sullae]
MKVHLGRLTVHGTGLDARRLADRLPQDLPAALSRALNGAPLREGYVEQVGQAIAQRLRDEIARKAAKP